MTKPQIRILIVEDDTVDRLACRRALSDNPDYEFVLYEAETGQAGLHLAHAHQPDCVLLDYHLPDMNGLEFLAELADEMGEIPIPVMMLTGADNAAVAVEAMKRGARDYLVKDMERQYLQLLPPVIERVLREQRLLEAKRQAEAKFRSLVEQIPAIAYIAALDEPGSLLYISPQIRTLGFSAEDWLADPEIHARQMHPDDRAQALGAISQSRMTGTSLNCEYRLFSRDGRVLWFRDEARVVRDESGRMLFLQGLLLDITEAKQKEQDLRQSREMLRQLAAHHESVREEERKRIAREIHDELGQQLTALQLEVSLLPILSGDVRPALTEKINSILRLIQDTMTTVRTIAAQLRPSVLDLGLADAIQWQVQEFQDRSGIACKLILGTEDITLDDSQDTAIFRILQESLTNIARHAQATEVNITLNLVNGVLSMKVEDNGIGISQSGRKKPNSFGLLGIKERTLLLGGAFTIDDAPGKGTVLTVSIPAGAGTEAAQG